MDQGPLPSGGEEQRRRRSPRVIWVLLLVSIPPLIGLAVVTWTAVDEARSATTAATRTEALTEEVIALAELDNAVFDELLMNAGYAAAALFDAPEGSLTGYLATETERAEMTQRVDRLVAEAGQSALATELPGARAEGLELGAVLDRYSSVIQSIEAALDSSLAELGEVGLPSSQSRAVLDSLDAVHRSIEVRALLASQFYTTAASVFAIRGTPAEEIAELIAIREFYGTTLEELLTDPEATPEVTAAVAAIAEEPSVERMIADVDAVIASALTDGLPPAAGPLDLPTLLANIDVLTNATQALTDASELSSILLDETAEDAVEAAEQVRSAARSAVRSSALLAVGLLLASVLTAVLAGLYIVRPLHRLRDLAERVRSESNLMDLPAADGPAEVCAAGDAIRDAGCHLDLVTRQARALSSGDLDAPVLDEEAPGGLGPALQEAVNTLRTALMKQDEFRTRLAHEAAHDGLTKLANRSSSMAHLTRALARTGRSNSQLAVLFVDLDHFKEVNDLHGHQAGDTVLKAAAERIVASVREGDQVGRLGGDEFVVIAEPVEHVDEAVGIAQRIIDQITEPFEGPQGEFSIGASIGIAITDGTELTADELLRDADLAVYRAKAVGRGHIEICDEDLRKMIAETADLTQAIRNAIAHDELVMHYQPIVEPRTARVHAVEALVRWCRPGESSLVPPDVFIGFAERSNLIIEIDRWVISAVARQIAIWTDDPEYSGVPVAINVSGRHLASDDFVGHVLEPLAEHGVDPTNIIVEITESALLDDLGAVAGKLQSLREVGIRVSIDDFGTGYTSLAHLRSLPIDILKIDRSYTVNAPKSAHEASIVKLIIDTGHLLGATITAEGIETVEEEALLTELGSDFLQGYRFARPEPAASRTEPARSAHVR